MNLNVYRSKSEKMSIMSLNFEKFNVISIVKVVQTLLKAYENFEATEEFTRKVINNNFPNLNFRFLIDDFETSEYVANIFLDTLTADISKIFRYNGNIDQTQEICINTYFNIYKEDFSYSYDCANTPKINENLRDVNSKDLEKIKSFILNLKDLFFIYDNNLLSI